jgi:putative tryptophan/tyrosine transport system substrate-binding protein
MNRREFITLIPGAVVAGPLIARAQSRMPTVGVLVLGSPAPEPFLMALREGLQKVGYIEGQNIRIEFRSAGGQADLLPDAAAELVRLKVDVIVAWQTPAAQSVKQARTRSRSLWQGWAILSERVSLPAWRGRARTSPDRRLRAKM